MFLSLISHRLLFLFSLSILPQGRDAFPLVLILNSIALPKPPSKVSATADPISMGLLGIFLLFSVPLSPCAILFPTRALILNDGIIRLVQPADNPFYSTLTLITTRNSMQVDSIRLTDSCAVVQLLLSHRSRAERTCNITLTSPNGREDLEVGPCNEASHVRNCQSARRLLKISG